MDGESFDKVAQRVSVAATRRGLLRAGVGALAGALGLVGLTPREDVAARKRRKRCGSGGPCRVFVTSTTYGGSIGGLSGADGICQSLATSAGLRGTYKAWLSDSTASPSTRFVRSSGPYRLLDGTTIAANWKDLTDGALKAPITMTETRNTVTGAQFAWTYTNLDGTAAPGDVHCENWKAANGFGADGMVTFANSTWTQGSTATCDTEQHLYCFQQSGR